MRKPDILIKLKEFPYDPKGYWVITGAALVLYGIKEECSDIDLGCSSKMADQLEAEGYLYKKTSDGNRWFKVGNDIEVFENWLKDTVTHVEDIPVITLQGTIEMKQELGREKDLKDIQLILDYMNQNLKGETDET